jgi:hypothetical protein
MRGGSPKRALRHKEERAGLLERQAAELERLKVAHRRERDALDKRHADERWAAAHPPPPAAAKAKGGRR